MRTGLKSGLRIIAVICAVVGFYFCALLTDGQPAHAATGINQQLNFQGRLLDSNGAVVADGSYNMEFKIVQDGDGCNPTTGTFPCSGTVKWTEDWIQTNRVTVKNGYFSANLGSITAFGSSVDWNQDTLWLSINIGGTTNTPTPTWDGAMKPLKRLTSTPYSLNSNALQGLQAANFVQLAQSSSAQADNSTANPSIFINKNNSSGTPNIIELQKSGTDVLTVNNSGDLILGKAGTGGLNGKLVFSTTNASNSTITIQAASTGTGYSLTLPTTGPTTSQCLQSDPSTASQLIFSACGSTTVSYSSSQNTNGGAISGSTLTLYKADGNNPGLVSSDAQTFGGTKTFNSAIAAPTSSNTINGLIINSGALSGITTYSQANNVNTNDIFNLSNNALTTSGNDLASLSFKNNNSSGSSTINGLTISEQASNAGGTNTSNLLNLTANAGGTINGIKLGANFTNALVVNGTTVVDGSGNISTGRLTGNYVASISNGNGLSGSCSSNNCAAALSVNNGNGLTFSSGALTISNGNGLTFSGSSLVVNNGTGLTFSGSALTIDTTAGLSWSGNEAFTGAVTMTPTGSNNVTVNLGVSGASGVFRVQTNGTDALRVDASGNVTLTSGAGSDVIVNNQITLDPGTDALNGITMQNSSGASLVSLNTLSSGLNLIPNSSFEQNINGWTAKGAATVSHDSTAGNTASGGFGNSTLKAVTTAVGDGAQYTYPLLKSTQYTLTMVLKSDASLASSTLGWQENGVDVVTGCSTFTITTTWTQQSCTFTTTSGTFNNSTNVFVKTGTGSNHTIYVDGVTLTKAGSGLTFINPGQNFDINSAYDILTLNNQQNAEPQPWQLSANPIGTGRRHASVATGDGYLYFIGGETVTPALSTDVNYAKLNADGTVGSWQTLSGVLPAGVYGHASVVYNGYLYVLGGCITTADATANCTTRTSNVYYAQIKPDGTLGKFFANPNTLTTATGFGNAAVANGYIYFLGGYTGSVVSTVMSAKINADGTTGPFSSSGLNSLNTAVYGSSAVVANGNIYLVGGCTDTASGAICNTASNVVQYTTPTTSGGDSTFTATGNNTNFTATGLNNAVLLNGYIYSIGGRQSSAAVNTVSYAKILGSSLLGPWTNDTSPPTDTNHPLPFARQGAVSIENNSYIYTIGGTDSSSGTNVYGTVYQSGGARTLIYGGLDLVGLSGLTMSDPSGQGTLTAGDTKIIGNLRVDNLTTLNNGLAVNGPMNISNTSALYSILNITNQPSSTAANNLNLLTLRDTSVSGNNNFGGLTISGGFLGQQSYYGEEFNNFHSSCTQTLATTVNQEAGVRGDFSANAACTTTATVSSGEISISSIAGSSAVSGSAVFSSNALNGFERIACAAGNSARSTSCLETSNNGAAGGQNAFFNTNNMPQVAMKYRVGNGVNPGAGNPYYMGISNIAIAATTGAGNSFAAANKGVFFTNCTTSLGTIASCGNTWFGDVADGASEHEVSCPATDAQGSSPQSTNFMYGRFEFRKVPATTVVEIEFFIDYDVGNGIKETSCGTVSAVASGALTNVNMGPFMAETASGSTSNTLDIDYFRAWQDDAATNDAAPSGSTSQNLQTAGPNISQPSTPPLTNDSELLSDQVGIIDFSAATSEDTTFNNDVYVHGTLFANKVVANQIEGLDVITDEINSLKDKLASAKPSTQQTPSGLSTGKLPTSVKFTSLQTSNLLVLSSAEFKGPLTIDQDAHFNGKTIFELLAQFNGPAQFNGQVTFNNDAGGQVVIHKDAQKITVKFSKAYRQAPIVVGNWLFSDTKDQNGSITDSSDAKLQRILDGGYSFTVANVTTRSFDIVLNKKATEDLSLSWIATSINNALISQNSQ